MTLADDLPDPDVAFGAKSRLGVLLEHLGAIEVRVSRGGSPIRCQATPETAPLAT